MNFKCIVNGLLGKVKMQLVSNKTHRLKKRCHEDPSIFLLVINIKFEEFHKTCMNMFSLHLFCSSPREGVKKK